MAVLSLRSIGRMRGGSPSPTLWAVIPAILPKDRRKEGGKRSRTFHTPSTVRAILCNVRLFNLLDYYSHFSSEETELAQGHTAIVGTGLRTVHACLWSFHFTSMIK